MRSNRVWLALTSAMIVAPGQSLEHRLGQDHHDLVAPDHPALAVDRADPIAVAVEGDADVEALSRTSAFRCARLASTVGSGWWLGKVPSIQREDRVMLARQPPISFSSRRAGGAVARVPADLEALAAEILDQPVDIGVEDVHVLDLAVALAPFARSGAAPELLDFLAEHRAAVQKHLEAVIVGRVVASGDLDPAADAERLGGEIEHRAWADSDPDDVDPAFGQAVDERGFEPGRMKAAVAADRDPRHAFARRRAIRRSGRAR
jgi:hypothetical protein